MYYLQSRYYDSEVGRFISADAYAVTYGSAIGANMFAYCGNNPSVMVDSDGNSFERTTEFFNYYGSLIEEDLDSFSWDNSNESEVIRANVFSAYKNKLVIKLPIGGYGVSFGIMGIGDKVKNKEVVKHEYGHTVQFDNMGIAQYTSSVAIPSVTINVLDRLGKLPYDYYSYPWEAEANKYGNADLKQKRKEPLPVGSDTSYQGLIKLFFE